MFMPEKGVSDRLGSIDVGDFIENQERKCHYGVELVSKSFIEEAVFELENWMRT